MVANEIKSSDDFQGYFNYLKNIRLSGRIYKRFISSRILYASARQFGNRMIEVGSGTGAGVLGAYPNQVVGLEINPYAVQYSINLGLRARLIAQDGIFPEADMTFDSCILDNVIEHIEHPSKILAECFRVTRPHGGLVIAVPGIRGFAHDRDHKVYYDEERLRKLSPQWHVKRVFSMPFFMKSARLSRTFRQYCLVGVFGKE